MLIVDNTVQALQEIATAHRRKFTYPVVGITGSNGKTIVKEWLSILLQTDFTVVKSPKSYNSQIGVPLSVWRMQERHSIAVFEAGISLAGEMQKLEKIIRPEIGIFTNIGTAHADGFRDQQHKVEEKLKLFQHSKVVIYCKDHQLIDETMNANKAIDSISWSFGKTDSDIQVSFKDQILIIADQKGKTHRFTPKFTDSASLENLVHCLVVCLYLRIDTQHHKRAIDQIASVQMRLTLKEAVNGCYVIDDSYNTDLSALEVALDFLTRQDQRAYKTVILSDILQSGVSAKTLYGAVAELLNRKQIDRLIGIGEEIRSIEGQTEIKSEFYPSTAAFLAAKPEFSEEMILVKGARSFQLEKIVRFLEQKTHGTVLEVNMEALSHNLIFYRQQLSTDTKLMVMVKALAYGGSYEIANLLQYHGVDYLGVAYADEGVRLRKNGITLPIMVLNVTEESFELLSRYQLQPEIYSIGQLNRLIAYFHGQEAPPIHIKLETGMNRLGFVAGELPELTNILQQNSNLTIAGVFTHLAGADDARHEEFSHEQLRLFEKLSSRITKVIGYQPLFHVLNTSGITRFPGHHMDMVRLGIGLYGYDPYNAGNLKVVSTLKTTVSQLKKVKKGESIGYGRSFFADKDMDIAIIAIGYADGFRRSLSNGAGRVLIGGSLAPVVGNVCMDMTMIDVSGLRVAAGDEVVIFGDNPRIEELAKWLDTIPYEILTNVGDRVKRIFISE